MTDIFHQEAFNDINRTRSKLSTYGKNKNQDRHRKILESRTTLSRIRLSNHELMIEKGSHRNVKLPFLPDGNT